MSTIIRPPRNNDEISSWRDIVTSILMGTRSAFNFLADKAKFGTTTSYTEFQSDGSMVAVGDATCFLDELSPLIGQRLESPSSDIIQDNSEGAVYFKDTCIYGTDYVSFSMQINHDWDYEDLEPHLHWWQASSNVPNWILQYRWQDNGQAKTTSWTPLAWDSHAFTYSSGTLNQITSFGTIAATANVGVSSILQIRLTRDTTNVSTLFAGADPLTGNVYGVSFDCHKSVNTLGSRQRYVK